MTVTSSYNTINTKPIFQTNTVPSDTPLSPDILGLSGGGFVSAYTLDDPTDGRLFLNFYNSAHTAMGGAVVATENLPAQTDATGQPRLTELANGNVLVVWDENNNFESDAGLKGRVFTPAGIAQGSEMDLSDLGFVDYSEVNVAALSDGNFVITYVPSAGGGINARIYSPGGNLQPAGVITVEANTNLHDSQVVALAGGGYVVVWTDQNAADGVIRARVYGNDGAPAPGGAQTIAIDGDNRQPEIAALPNGNFALVYADSGWGGAEGASHGITLQIFDPTLSNVTPGLFVHVNTPDTKEQSDPTVSVLSNGFIMVTWTHVFGPTDHDVFARIFDQGGNPITQNGNPNQFEISQTLAEEQLSASSALLGGEFIVSWQDSTTDGEGGRVSSMIKELTRTVQGDSDSDNYLGDSLRETINGDAGGDTLNGAGGSDTINGGDGYDLIYGGTGGDLLQGDYFSDEIHGGTGNDAIYGGTQADPFSSTFSDWLYGEGGVDRIRGASGDDQIDGGAQGDKLNGSAGSDALAGGTGEDKLKGSSGNDVLSGGDQEDTLNGGVGDVLIYAMDSIGSSSAGDAINGAAGNDTCYGSGGVDTIVGLDGKDVLSGGGGSDFIDGGSGKDIILGGAGDDLLTGGGDKDTFRFVSVTDSLTLNEDVITDLGNLDVIDLSQIDAKTINPGDQAFTLVAAFSGARGELVIEYHASGDYAGLTTFQGDVDGDSVADFTITASGDRHNFTNFVL